MKNNLKLWVSILSTATLASCSFGSNTDDKEHNKNIPNDNRSSFIIEEEKENTPNSGGWPTLDTLPINGTIGPSKTAFFSERTFESRFNTWKTNKDDFAKRIYLSSAQGQSDMALYYKGTKEEWFNSAAATSAYNTWRTGSGKSALTTAWKASADYTTKKAAYIAGGTSTKRNKATWLTLSDSTASYNTWRLQRKSALKSAWEATNSGATSFTTKLGSYTSAHTTNTKEKYADLATSNNDYNTWRAKRSTDLKNAWEATDSGTNEFMNKVDAWMTANHASLDTKAEWLADGESDASFSAWKGALTTDQKKLIWEGTHDFIHESETQVTADEFLRDEESNFNDDMISWLFDSRRISLQPGFTLASNTTYTMSNASIMVKSALRNFFKKADDEAYNYPEVATVFAGSTTAAERNVYINAWRTLLNDKGSDPDLKADVLTIFKKVVDHDTHVDHIDDTRFFAYVKKIYKTAAHSAHYTNAFNAWNTDANLRTHWNTLTSETNTAYKSYKATKYKAGSSYNTDLDAWSATKANGLPTYKLSSDLTTDYATWIKAQYKASATYNTDLDAWSITKSNASSIYNADADSTSDYNSWSDPNQRTAARYDANHLNQFETDLAIWTSVKANGKTIYFAADASDNAFDGFTNPTPNDLSQYQESAFFASKFDDFVTNNLTWSTYKDYFIKQVYESTEFKNLYHNYLLDE